MENNITLPVISPEITEPELLASLRTYLNQRIEKKEITEITEKDVQEAVIEIAIEAGENRINEICGYLTILDYSAFVQTKAEAPAPQVVEPEGGYYDHLIKKIEIKKSKKKE